MGNMGSSDGGGLSDIPIIGSLLGGGGGSGLLGGVLDMTGLPQLIEKVLIMYVGMEILFKLIDKA